MTTHLDATADALHHTAARLVRARGPHAAGAADRGRQHRAGLRPAEHRRGLPPVGVHPVVDRRRLLAGARRTAGRDGQPRRPHRPAPAADDRRRRLRRGVRRRGVRAQRRDAGRGPRRARLLRRHADALDAVADPQHLHRASARRLAIAIWASCFTAGSALGPIVGGALLQHFHWGSVFLVAVPILLPLLVLAPRWCPSRGTPIRARWT